MSKINLGSLARWGIKKAIGTERGTHMIAAVESIEVEQAAQYAELIKLVSGGRLDLAALLERGRLNLPSTGRPLT